jgi:Transposase DDE domain
MTAAFDLEASRRLPLADAAFRLVDFVTDAEFLTGVFQRHRGRSFENTIDFPLFVHLIADALFGHRGSAHQTFSEAQEEGRLTASVQAVYGKLRRVPIGLSLGLFAESAARLASIGTATSERLPSSLEGFCSLAFDGKKLKYIVKRLKPLRGLKGNVFGGKLLIVQDMATGQAVGAEATVDGEAGDNPLVPGVVARVRAGADSRTRLWVGDRAFCDLQILPLLSAGDDHFAVRYHAKCHFHADPAVAARTGIDDVGREYREQWGWLGAVDRPDRARVRQITVERPSAEPLVLVTSLADADRYPAVDLLILYRRRWGIETMFQQVVQTFDLRHLIGGSAQATVFQAIFCLLVYNITLIVRDYVAEGAERAAATVSLRLLFDDLVRDLTAWMEVIGPHATTEVLAATTLASAADLRRFLEQTLSGVWTKRWIKQKTRKRPPKRPPRAYLRGGHSSVDRILRGAHKEIPIRPRKQSE